MCKISIIIPVFNAEKYIENCLNSIIKQTLRDIEIIIINDGSHDNSLEICKRYSSIDSRIKLIDKKNEGVSVSRNKGIDLTQGEYIMFIDADDWIEEDMCEIMYNNIIDNDTDLVLCNHIMEYENKSKKISFNSDKDIVFANNIGQSIILPLIEEEKGEKTHERASFRSPWGKLFKSEIIRKQNLKFDRELIIGEDFIFNLNYIKNCKSISMCNEYLYHYRMDNESALNKYRKDSWIVYKNLLTKLEEYLKYNFQESEYSNRLNKLKLKYLLTCIQNEKNVLNKKNIIEKRNYIKNICNEELMEEVLKKYSKQIKDKKSKIKLILLKNKIYLPFIINKNL